jgi:hypothetical protein
MSDRKESDARYARSKKGKARMAGGDVLAWAVEVPARFVGTSHGLIHDSKPRLDMTFPKLRRPS